MKSLCKVQQVMYVCAKINATFIMINLGSIRKFMHLFIEYKENLDFEKLYTFLHCFKENLPHRVSFCIKPLTDDCYRYQILTILILLRSYIYHVYAYSSLKHHENNFIRNTYKV